MNSRRKGADGERELAQVLKRLGFETRRGCQYSAANGDADVVGVEGLHIECKRVEKLNIDTAMQQSRRDARENEIPVVMHRKNHKTWLVTMDLVEFIRLWKGTHDGNRTNEDGA